jgi:orotate phosphoribosyltransferase
MIYNQKNALTIAEQLINIEAVKISIENPFTWTSGIKSPIYCDNRLTLSDFNIRDLIKHTFIRLIKEHFENVECIAGVATAGIPHASFIADSLNKPLVYVRNKPKGHGLGNQIEGKVIPGQKIVVVEDLVSTGKSSLDAVKALRDSGCDVLGMVAIFTYGFSETYRLFEKNKCPLWTLCDYEILRQINSELPDFQPDFSSTSLN